MSIRIAVPWLVPALGLAALASAATPPPNQDSASAVEASAQVTDAAAALAKLNDAFDAAFGAWVEKMRAAEGEPSEELFAARPGKEFVPQYRDLAYSIAGTPEASQAWMKVAQLSLQIDDFESAEEAIAVIVEESSGQQQLLTDLAQQLRYAQAEPSKKVTLLRKVFGAAEQRDVRGAVQFALAVSMMDLGDETSEKEAVALLKDLETDYQDVADARGNSWGKQAAGFLFEYENLRVGKLAPEYEAVDQDGVGFKLSDYRGKVVVLDFWGFW